MTDYSDDFYSYYLSIYNDTLFFDNDIYETLENSKKIILSDDYLESLCSKIGDMKEQLFYPKKAIDNIENIIDYIKENIENSNELLDYIIEEFEYIKQMPCSDKIYISELMIKFIDVDLYLDLQKLKINKEMIENSIYFDLIALYDLTHDSEIKSSDYYILSLKKFIHDFPEMFLDENINSKALEILDKNALNKDAERLRYKITNIKKFINNNFDYVKFKALFDYVLVQNMIIDKENINRYKDFIDEELLNTVYYIIDNNLISSEIERKNLLEIVNIYKENTTKDLTKDELKQFLAIHNDYIGKINLMDPSDDKMTVSEYQIRQKRIHYMFNNLNIGYLIECDLCVLYMYLIDDQEYQKKIKKIDHKDLYLSINKFLKLAPSIFDNKIIYDRTMDMLDSNNIETRKTKNKVKRIYN